MAIAAIAMATAATETQANFAWITNTNGIVWKRDISYSSRTLSFKESDRSKVAQIVVPENTDINNIYVTDCINLTNIVIQTNNPIEVNMRNTRLQNITVRPGMEWKVWLVIDSKDTRIPLGLLGIKTTFAELPKMEIRTFQGGHGLGVQVIWRAGELQVSETVNGEWKDVDGNSPWSFPLASAKTKQFFRLKPAEAEEEPEESQ